MGPTTQELSKTIKYKDKVYTNGKMGKPTKANGLIIECMELGN
jgi:hypothetical protein